jgi:hypothetical protein
MMFDRKLLEELTRLRIIAELELKGDNFATEAEFKRMMDEPLESGSFVAVEVCKFFNVDANAVAFGGGVEKTEPNLVAE